MHGGGPGMQGGGIEQMIPKMLAEAKASLNLNTSQQATWDRLVAQSKAARDAARANRQQVKDAMAAQLAKAEPDLKRVVGAADPVSFENQAERRKLRDLWLDLYAGFSPEQKAVVRDLLRDRFDRTEAVHDRMRAQLQQRRGASGG